MTLHPGCTDCNEVSPADVDDDDGRAFLVDHSDCHGVLVLLRGGAADRDLPAAPTEVAWRPRVVQGPPLPGHAQRIYCPQCHAIGGDTAHDPVTWKRVDGIPAAFCRKCGHLWGRGVAAQADRDFLRGLRA